MARKKIRDRKSRLSETSIRAIKDFDSEVLGFLQGYVLVEFYSDWCKYCKKMTTVFKRLAPVFQDITFLKMDIDDDQEVAEEYCQEGIPNLVLFKDGEFWDDFVGYDKVTVVKEWLSEAIAGEVEPADEKAML